MITVSILINGNAIYTRSAVNVDDAKVGKRWGCSYKLDNGELLYHVPSEGAVKLAKMMLDTVIEVKRNQPTDQEVK